MGRDGMGRETRWARRFSMEKPAFELLGVAAMAERQLRSWSALGM